MVMLPRTLSWILVLGASYATQLGLTRDKLLSGTHYVTASRVTEKTMGITKEKLTIKDGPDGRQTTISLRLHILTSNHW